VHVAPFTPYKVENAPQSQVVGRANTSPRDWSTAGKLVFEHAVFKLEETPERRLILYSSLPNCDTARKVERLLGA
jgi:hypothetical protein